MTTPLSFKQCFTHSIVGMSVDDYRGARHMPSALFCAGASLEPPLRGYNRRLISSPESKPPMYTLARELLFKLSRKPPTICPWT